MENPFTELSEQLEAITQQLEARPDGHVSEWLNIDQAATYLNVSKSWIYKRTMNGTMNGTIPYYKTGRKLRFRRSELDDFISMGRVQNESLPGVTIEK